MDKIQSMRPVFPAKGPFDPSNRENLMNSGCALKPAKKTQETPANFYLDNREEHIVDINYQKGFVPALILVAKHPYILNFSGCYSSALMTGVNKVENPAFIDSKQTIFFPS
jgi:hypothetical protein